MSGLLRTYCARSESTGAPFAQAADILSGPPRLARADGSNLEDNDMPTTSSSPHVNVTFCRSPWRGHSRRAPRE